MTKEFYDLNELLLQLLDTYGSKRDRKAGKNMYTCPLCHSGDHRAGSTGALNVGRRDGNLVFFCHSCQVGGNIATLYSEYHGIKNNKENFPKIVKGIKEDLGISVEENSYSSFKQSYQFRSPISSEDLNPTTDVQQKDRTKFFNLALQSQNKAVEYLKSRGIVRAESIVRFFQIGFMEKFAYEFENNKPSKTTPAVIIPTSPYSYAWRSTATNMKKKSGTVAPLNIGALGDSFKKWIFLVEGEFDLFSILDITDDIPNCDFSAISVNSAGNLARFIENPINGNIQEDVGLIIALDSDMNTNPNVRKFVQEGVNSAMRHRIPCVVADVEALYLGYKDSNEALQHDRQAFKQALIHEVEKAKNLDITTYMKECEQMQTVQEPNITMIPTASTSEPQNSDGVMELIHEIVMLTKDDFSSVGGEYSPKILEISQKISDLDNIMDMEKARTSLHAMAKEHKCIASTKELFKKIDQNIKLANARQDRSDIIYPDYLEFDGKGKPKPTITNCYNILNFDENLQGKITYNQFTNQMFYDGVAWQDLHFSKLVEYIERNYAISNEKKINHAIKLVADENSYHPVKDYLNNLPEWDGTKRIGTMFSDFFGAENNEYTQAVATVTMCGAVARILKPATKFDTMTVLIGKQGIGKSIFWNKLGGDWYSDSVDNVKGKEAYESIQSAWIIEFAELSAMGRATVEEVKKFISKCTDKYRKPYATNTETIPRQCIFVGTTNNYEFLKDETGNRRFYPIDVEMKFVRLSVFDDLTPEYITQMWAEALYIYKKNGDNAIYIKNKKVLAMADEQQMLHFEKPTMFYEIQGYLDMAVPNDWDNRTLEERQEYIKEYNSNPSIGNYSRIREAICIKEILVDLYPDTYSLDRDISTDKSREVAKILVALGWTSSKKCKRYKLFKVQKTYSRNGSEV